MQYSNDKDQKFQLRLSAEEKAKLDKIAESEDTNPSDIIRKFISKRARKRVGFTLIELIVTMIIIGILASIATPIFLNQRKAAWKATVMADVTNAQLVTETASAGSNGAIDGLTFKTGTHDSPLLISAQSNTYKSPVSADNTVTEALGHTSDGAACYVITGVNANVSGWSYTKASNNDPTDCIDSTNTPIDINPSCETYTGDLDISEDETLKYCSVTGDIQVNAGVTVSAPKLTSIGGSLEQFGTFTSPVLETIGGRYVENAVNAKIEYPKLTSIGKGFQVTDSNTTVSASLLKTIGGDFEPFGIVKTPVLETIAGRYVENAVNADVTRPMLKTIGGDFQNTNSSTSNSMPVLETISGRADIWGTVSAPKLTSISGELYNWGTFTTPLLQTVNGKTV